MSAGAGAENRLPAANSFEHAGRVPTTTRSSVAWAATASCSTGGNGILLDNHVIRHMTDIEVLHTYEGTETIQTSIVGRDITGVSAFA